MQAEDAPKTTSLTATKTWNDNNNQDGKRASVIFDLYRKTDGDADYTKVDGQSRILNPDKNDNVQWTGLPVKVDGKTAAYKAVETTTLGGYDSQCADVQYNTDGIRLPPNNAPTRTRPKPRRSALKKHGTTPTTRTRSALTA